MRRLIEDIDPNYLSSFAAIQEKRAMFERLCEIVSSYFAASETGVPSQNLGSCY